MRDKQSLSIKTSRGILFKAISQIIRQPIQFLVLALLARLLKPEEFGLIAMVTVFINLFGMIADLGLGSAIIQKEELDKDEISSSFWVVVIFGFILTGIFFLLSPLIARFYQKEELVYISSALGLSFLFYSFGSISLYLLAREMKFGLIAIGEIVSVCFSSFCAVFLAYLGYGVWALVLQSLTYSFSYSALNFLLARFLPGLVLKLRKIKGMLTFGGNVLSYNLINYLVLNSDNMLIGKFLGSEPVGFYNFAYQIMLFPARKITLMVGNVMYPALSIIKKDHELSRNAYLRAVRMIITIVAPAMLGLFTIAPEFIKVILTGKWLPALFVLRVFCFIAIFYSISPSTTWIYLSQGRPDLRLKVGIVFTAIYLTAFILGLRWGINGVALCYLGAVMLIFYPNFKIPFRLIGLEVKNLVKELLPPLSASLLMMLAVFMYKQLALQIVGSWSLLLLAGEIIFGVAVYIFLTLLINQKALAEVEEFYKNILPGRIK